MTVNYTFYELFHNACAKDYDSAAVIYYKHGKYYQLLYSEAYGVCEYLFQQLQNLGLSAGYVGLYMAHNPLIPALIAAVHKNGSAFMFLDPEATNANNQSIIEEMNFHAIISICEYSDDLKDIIGLQRVKSISLYGYFVRYYKTAESTPAPLFSVDISYAVNISGKNDALKIIHVPHETLKRCIEELQRLFQPAVRDVIMLSTLLTFDPSVIELYLAVSGSSSLLMAPEDSYVMFPTGDNSKYAVTIWQLTPSKLLQFSDFDISHFIFGEYTSLRILILRGETLNNVKRLKTLRNVYNKTKLYSMYGMPRMSCWACVAEVCLQSMSTDEEIPIDSYLSSTKIMICKTNVKENIGRIMLGSRLRRCVKFDTPEELNFTKDGINWMETGDLGEVRNNRIYYRGQTEDVIERFGHEINLNQIERVAALCLNINSVSAVWLSDINFIILYFVSDLVTPKELKLYLRHKLNNLHQPDRTIQVPCLPLNAYGKVAKQILIANGVDLSKSKPDSMIHAFTKEIQDVIGLSMSYTTMKDKTFIELGGDSVSVVIFANRLSNLYEYHSINIKLATALLDSSCTIEKAFRILNQYRQRVEHVASRQSVHKRHSRTIKHHKLTKKHTDPSVTTCNQDKASSIEDSNFKILWRLNMDRCVDAIPAIFQSESGLLVCVGSHSGRIVVADGHTGLAKGSIETGSRIESAVLCFTRGSSAVATGVVGTHDGTIYCFTLEDCKISWSIDVKSIIKSQAVFAHGHIYVAAYDGYVRALNALDGYLKKNIYISSSGISSDLEISTNHAHIAVAALDGTCVILNTTSDKIEFNIKVNSPVFAKPVIFNQNTCVMFAEVNGVVQCFQIRSGTKLWSFSNVEGHIFSSALVSYDAGSGWRTMFGCNEGYVYCVGRVRGDAPALLWKTKVSCGVYATFCSIYKGGALVASSDGRLCVLDTTNGVIDDEYQLPGQVFSTPMTHCGKIYIGCRDDYLYCLHHSETV